MHTVPILSGLPALLELKRASLLLRGPAGVVTRTGLGLASFDGVFGEMRSEIVFYLSDDQGHSAARRTRRRSYDIRTRRRSRRWTGHLKHRIQFGTVTRNQRAHARGCYMRLPDRRANWKQRHAFGSVNGCARFRR